MAAAQRAIDTDSMSATAAPSSNGRRARTPRVRAREAAPRPAARIARSISLSSHAFGATGERRFSLRSEVQRNPE
jgi:hypothetical protein